MKSILIETPDELMELAEMVPDDRQAASLRNHRSMWRACMARDKALPYRLTLEMGRGARIVKVNERDGTMTWLATPNVRMARTWLKQRA